MGKCKYSPTERAYALESGDYQIYKSARLQLLKDDHIAFLHSSEYWAHLYLPDYDVCRCLFRSSYARGYRLRKRLMPMIVREGAWFLTLTFSDSVLSSTDAQRRRRYVREYLKSICVKYVANKDFGAHNEREHYHAVVSLPFDLAEFALVHDGRGCHSTLLGWPYGFSNWEKVGLHGDERDCVFVSKYLAKLTNHALKETAAHETMIYSRS